MSKLGDQQPANGQISCRTIYGTTLRGKLVKLARSVVAFEIYGPPEILRLSENLLDFKLTLNDQLAYDGPAVVSGLIQMASLTVCEAKLDSPGIYVGINMPFNGNIGFQDAYRMFFQKWQYQMRVAPEFKLAVSDLQSYLMEVKLLLEQIEMSLIAHPSRNRAELEKELFQELAKPILASIDAIHERFEEIAQKIPLELRGAHELLVHRQLHPLFLCSPFGHRTYYKPLGYAGDYEIMNMIHRNTFEGDTLYAKSVHYWLVNQWAAKSVRNRVLHMKTKLVEETARVMRQKRTARILNLGCGPAREVQEFIAESSLADRTEFTFLDFDSETLDFVTSTLERLKSLHNRHTRIKTQKMSVTQLIRYMAKPEESPLGTGFDLIYCGGLFDYLSDQMCQQLVSLFYEWIAPGGLVVVANMNDQQKPFRHMVELLLDWHLLYRDAEEMTAFAPDKASADDWTVIVEPVNVNLFLEVRKPGDK